MSKLIIIKNAIKKIHRLMKVFREDLPCQSSSRKPLVLLLHHRTRGLLPCLLNNHVFIARHSLYILREIPNHLSGFSSITFSRGVTSNPEVFILSGFISSCYLPIFHKQHSLKLILFFNHYGRSHISGPVNLRTAYILYY